MEMWTTNRLRSEFSAFFESKGHKIFPSSSLTNSGDPTVLLTTAGMQQFKPYYLDVAKADNELKTRRAASSQTCFRTTDIEEVGDETHNTFFEMLGNFSFGDYFKKEAIGFAFELLTKCYKIDPKRFVVTVFSGGSGITRDQESMEIWKELEFSERKGNFTFAGMEDNFWGPTGDQGPCGPTTEIYVDGVEIWNIVFNEFFYPGSREELLEGTTDKKLTPLKAQGVDTGMGLERLARVMQQKTNIFEIDVFNPLMAHLESYALRELPLSLQLKGKRIIADHLRGGAFLMAEGLAPSNVKTGYVLRRILRRAIRYAYQLQLPHQVFRELFALTANVYQESYPYLKENLPYVYDTFEKEYQLFGRTIKKGTQMFENIASKHRSGTLKGKEVFHLYATFGFPYELIEEMAAEQGLALDKKEFLFALQKHKTISKGKVKQ